jgi:hypothetical protein
MRIFIDRSAVNGLVSQSRLRLVALPKQLDGVTHELDYLTDRPTAAYDKEEESFARLAAMYPKGKPLRVRRQYIDTFKAMNAMRKARGRPPIRYQALPGYKTPSV